MVEIPEQAVKVFMDSFWGAASVFVEPSHVKVALTAAAPYMSGLKVNNDVVERVARAWASIDGKSSEFDRAKKDREFDRTDGSYSGYMAEAKELIKRSGLFDTEPSSAREQALEEILRELSGNPRQLIDMMASAIRVDGSDLCDGSWESLSYDRKQAWRGDAERALAAVKEYLTTRVGLSGGGNHGQ